MSKRIGHKQPLMSLVEKRADTHYVLNCIDMVTEERCYYMGYVDGLNFAIKRVEECDLLECEERGDEDAES